MRNTILVIIFALILGAIGVDIKYRLQPKVLVIEKNVSPIPHEYLGEFDTTHYSHTGNRCSTGVYPKAGRTVAVDPKIIPYGTYLYVEGYGVLICEDCGGDIKGNRLDVFVNSHNEAIKLGRKKVRVWKLSLDK